MEIIRLGRRRFCARTLITSLVNRTGGALRALARDIGAVEAARGPDDASVRRDALAFLWRPQGAAGGQRRAA